MLIDRFANDATPDEAALLVVPVSVPLPGFVPIAIAIVALELVTVLFRASVTATVTAGESEVPAVALVGCWTNASLAAAPGLTLNAVLVADVKPVDDIASV